eukprot:TRINITY_DN7519_c0_g2_i4.p1 TRINITY_DN7519_c0_g2~~TRINITY_DN7519_c0_g2_i4.p1  ORF type:complete len:113 (-),score=9.29 TRINITY_DN7519_c0_g2_i4:145-483(-)
MGTEVLVSVALESTTFNPHKVNYEDFQVVILVLEGEAYEKSPKGAIVKSVKARAPELLQGFSFFFSTLIRGFTGGPVSVEGYKKIKEKVCEAWPLFGFPRGHVLRCHGRCRG